jgi:hypothetical protein
MIYRARRLNQIAASVRKTRREAAMYELLGALAFAALLAGYVLAVVFIRHQDDPGLGSRRPARPDKRV